MFNSVFTKTLWERRRSLLIWSVGLFLYALMVGLLYPSVEGVEGFEQFAEQMPEAMQALLGELDDIVSPEGFLAAEMYTLVFPLLLSILAIGFGAAVVSKEEESGTIELLLAKPISRSRVLAQKTLGMTANLVVVGISTWLGIALSTLLVDFDVNLLYVAGATLAAVLLALCFGMVALSLTAVGGKRGLAVGVSVAVLTVSYFADTLAVLVSWIEPLQRLSLLYYYDVREVISSGLEWQNLAVFLIFLGIVYIIGAVRFRTRDIGV